MAASQMLLKGKKTMAGTTGTKETTGHLFGFFFMMWPECHLNQPNVYKFAGKQSPETSSSILVQ
jgi:hypothetical protein